MNDPRPPQHPFSRPPERPLIHNPNHQPSPQPPQSQQHYGTYPPPASQPQPPVHIPFSSDPYTASRRDPFLPSAPQQHTRKGSYGIQSGESIPQGHGDRPAATVAWGNTATHPPPSMSTPHNNPVQPPYHYDASRRRSLEAASPPSYKGAPPPPPPPPSFARPHMPPPSSPQQQYNHGPQSQNPRASFPPAFGSGRELPGLGVGRPGSSMSISSLIGGDAAANNHPAPTQSSPPGASANALSSSSHSMQPPSPRRGFSSGSRSDFPPYRRQPSPERHTYTSRHSEGHAYSANSPTRSYSSNHGSPDHSRQSSQSYRPMMFQGSRPPASSPTDTYGREQRHSGPTIPQRPNSQPSGPGGPPETELRTGYDNMGGRRSAYGQSTEERRRTLGESHHSRPNVTEILGGAPQNSTDRDRPVTVQPVTHSVFSPPRNERGPVGAHHTQPGIWRRVSPEEAQRESPEIRREEHSTPFRSNYGPYPASSQPLQSYGSAVPEDMARGRSVDHLNHRIAEPYHIAPTSDPNSTDRQRAEQLTRSMSSNSYPGRSLYDQPRRMGEEMQHSKSFLGLGPESNRRTGRASPLPQAVQGAQAQPVSIGKDPGIKSEFGRMFSGLGSGLGSSTPTRQSPMPQNGGELVPPGPDGNDLRMQRVSSQNGRKPKRVKDEEIALDGDIPNGRGTPSLMGSRGGKRSKQSHHHHHHTHAHHHHHHHHKPEEDLTVLAQNAPSASSTPFNNGRYNSGLPPNGAAQASHHHHHYHGTPHHHHHAARSGQPIPFEAAKISPKVHDIQPVLDEASKQPRRHLGSQLYQANPTLPKPNSQLDDQFSYASKPKGLPRFPKNPINSTFTIRVPRYYLKPRQRQHIVLQRHLWGARIYRDDSDPIAAAIHSGWIRGEWDETVDVNMLDPRLAAPNDPKDAEETLTQIPAAPVTPPADMELHITLLILPRIQQYYGTCEYGITSHKSANHDGLSFMIEKIKWVDEGFGERGQERGATALKRRLDASQALLSLMNGNESTLRPVNGTARINA